MLTALLHPSLGIVVLACLASCYFAACQIALRDFSRPRMQELLDPEGTGNLDRYQTFLDEVPRLLVMTGFVRSLLNLIVVLAVLYLTELSFPDFPRLTAFSIAFLISGALVTIFSVGIPVSLAIYFPERMLAKTIGVLELGLLIFLPVASILNLVDPVVRRIWRPSEPQTPDEIVSQEVLSVVEEHQEEGQVDQTQREMLAAVFELPSTTAGQIMTPRTDIQGIEITAPIEEIKNAILRGGYSRLPVYQQSLDNIVGMLYAKDMIQFLGQSGPLDIRKILRDALMVPESKPLRELLAEFKARKVHIAIVLDEYGGTAGLVTIEDIIEEIVGDIQDEYENQQEKPSIRRIDERTFDVEARAYIDDLNEELGGELPEDEDYDTLGGFVFSTLGHIPTKGETFEFQNLRMTITDVDRTKVKAVRIELLESKPAESPESQEPERRE